MRKVSYIKQGGIECESKMEAVSELYGHSVACGRNRRVCNQGWYESLSGVDTTSIVTTSMAVSSGLDDFACIDGLCIVLGTDRAEGCETNSTSVNVLCHSTRLQLFLVVCFFCYEAVLVCIYLVDCALGVDCNYHDPMLAHF